MQIPKRTGTRVRSALGPLLVAGLLAVLLGLGLADGGYFATSWGWATLAFLWLIVARVLLRSPLSLSPSSLFFVVAISAFTIWVGLSVFWSSRPAQSVLELERALVYVTAVVATLVLVRRGSVTAFLSGVVAVGTGLCLFALYTRLFPDAPGGGNPGTEYRLSEPLGYWNALGILAASTVVVAIGLAASCRRPAMRALAAAAVPPLAATIYFTFSRGSWLALAVGLTFSLILARTRASLLLVVLAVGPPAAVAAVVASRSEALTRLDRIEDAASEGPRFAAVLLALTVVGATAAALTVRAEPHIGLTPRAQRSLVLGVLLAALTCTIALSATVLSPNELVTKAKGAFRAPVPRTEGQPQQRLTSLSINRTTHWQVAWEGYRDDPVLGSGAGTYETLWYRLRSEIFRARDAHSLYLETLTELGPAGLFLLLAALATPLVAAVRIRGELAPVGAAGGYVAYLAHAGVDWDWEMPAVTVSALMLACAVLASAAKRPSFDLTLWGRRAVVGASAAIGAFVLITLAGSTALEKSEASARAGLWSEAEEQAELARRWAPWSPDPLRRLAEAQLGRQKPRQARRNLRRALAKDSQDWTLWLEFAYATEGAVRRVALNRAARLNPLEPEIYDAGREIRPGP